MGYYNSTYVEPYVLTYNFDEIKAKEKCNILCFSDVDVKWAQFIVNNRNGFEYMNCIGSEFHNIKHNFDIVQGAIADKEIVLLAKTLNNLKKKVKEEDVNNILYDYMTKQISFHTYESLEYLQLTRCDIIREKKGDVANG